MAGTYKRSNASSLLIQVGRIGEIMGTCRLQQADSRRIVILGTGCFVKGDKAYEK